MLVPESRRAAAAWKVLVRGAASLWWGFLAAWTAVALFELGVFAPGKAALQAEPAFEAKLAEGFENLFSSIAERAASAVVAVGVVDSSDESEFGGYSHDFSELPSLGSGFFIDPSGYLLTSYHVIRDGRRILVKLVDGREFAARKIGADPASDIALLKIEAEGIEVLPLGESKVARVGQWVLAVGCPFGLAHTVSAGIISATHRTDLHILPFESFLQTDAAIHPGNSGGPLVNLRGEAIGINAAVFSDRKGTSQRIGFAVPIDLAKALARQWIAGRRECYLGVVPLRVDKEMAQYYGLPSPRGAFVASVTKGSPADLCGLRPRDVILRLGGTEVRDENHLRILVAGCAPGESVPLEVLRQGGTERLEVVLREKESSLRELGEDRTPERTEPKTRLLGITVSSIDPGIAAQIGVRPDVQGLAILEVQPRSPADRKGLREGDVIVGANERPVRSIEDLKAAVEGPGDVILLEVLRAGSQTLYVFVKR